MRWGILRVHGGWPVGAPRFLAPVEADAEPLGGDVGVLHRRKYLSDLAGRSQQMGETALAALDFDRVIGCVSIGHEKGFEPLAEEFLGGFCRAVRIDPEYGDVFIAGIPDDHVPAIFAPVGLIGVHDVAVAHLLYQISVEWFAVVAGSFFKPQRTGRNVVESEKRAHHLLDLAIGKLDFVAQIEGGGFGFGTDGSEGELSFELFEHLPAAPGTIRGLVDVGGDLCYRAQDDVFLDIGGGAAARKIGGSVTVGAGAGGIDMHGLVNALGNLACPWGMACGSATFLGSGRCFWLISNYTFRGGLACLAVFVVRFESALMEALVLGSQAVDFRALFT